MSLLTSLQVDMFDLLDRLNTTAAEVSDNLKSSVVNFDTDSVRSFVMETNDRVSRIFSPEGDDCQSDQGSAWFRPGQLSVTPPQNNHKFLANNGHMSSLDRLAREDSTCCVSDTDELPAFDEQVPGYAKPAAYLTEREVCRPVVVTDRKLTEADLDSSDPLYCDRDTRTRQGMTSASPVVDEQGGTWENEDEDDLAEIVQCFRVQFERLRILFLESFN